MLKKTHEQKGRCLKTNYYSLLNTPVTEYCSGRKIGYVDDIYLKENSTEIIGISAKKGSLIYRSRLFTREHILFTGINKVSVKGFGTGFFLRPKIPKAVSFKHLIGLKAEADDNNIFIGTVKDGYFDMEAGRFSALLIGRGIADDLLTGRKFLTAEAFKTENGVLKVKNPSVISKRRGAYFPK